MQRWSRSTLPTRCTSRKVTAWRSSTQVPAPAATAKCQRTVPTSSTRPSRSWAARRMYAWSRGSPRVLASVVGRPTQLRSCDGPERPGCRVGNGSRARLRRPLLLRRWRQGQGPRDRARSSSHCRSHDVANGTYTLLVPPFGVATAAVYQAWDVLGGPVSDNFNDLEPAALHVEPRLASWRDRLADATGQRPVLAGSGSTWFVPGAHPGAEPGCRPGFAG